MVVLGGGGFAFRAFRHGRPFLRQVGGRSHGWPKSLGPYLPKMGEMESLGLDWYMGKNRKKGQEKTACLRRH